MPTIDQPGRQSDERHDDAQLAHDPLTSLEAERAHEDALRRASERWMNPMISSAQGRVEEETRRLTERMAREEQARRLAAQPTPRMRAYNSARSAVRRVEGRRLPAGEPIQRILLSLDGSLWSERALPYAEALARMVGAEIVVGSSTDRADLAQRAGADPTHVAGDALASALIRARMRALTSGLRAQARIIYNPLPADGVLSLQQELDATVIAMASHVRARSDRALAGSVTLEALRENWAYTLVVPSGAADLLDRRCVYRRILTPLDGSATAESALALLSMLLTQPAPDARPRRVTLLFVAGSHAQENDGAAYLHEVQAALERETGVHGIVYTKVAVGKAPEVIIEEASAARAAIPSVARYDLTLLASRGEASGGRWTLGGVPTYALTHGDSPLLFARAPHEASG